MQILHGTTDGKNPDQYFKKTDNGSQVFIALGHENNAHGVECNITNPQTKYAQGKQKVIEIGRIEYFHFDVFLIEPGAQIYSIFSMPAKQTPIMKKGIRKIESLLDWCMDAILQFL
jgi:hypothetical protein